MAMAIFVSLESAPKDIWEIYTGMESVMGFLACLPITVFKDTSACSSRGMGFNWAPRMSTSSQFGMDIRVPIAAMADLPETAIS